MEPEDSLRHSQVPATCPYPEPVRSTTYPLIPQNKITIKEVHKCGRIVRIERSEVKDMEVATYNPNKRETF
jgi:hypothetical protein